MTSRLALRELEKRAWLRTFEHGLWDIGIGSLFLMFGVSILVRFPALSAIWVAGLLPGLRQTGRRLILPRIGAVQFRDRRKLANRRLTGILTATTMLGVVALGIMLWLAHGNAPGWVVWIGDHFVIVLGLVWGGALAVAAWLADFPRLYAYGALILGSMIVTDFVPGYPLGWSLTGAGGAILLAGILLLIRFLARYPKHPSAESELADD
jgi:hypothetical protein